MGFKPSGRRGKKSKKGKSQRAAGIAGLASAGMAAATRAGRGSPSSQRMARSAGLGRLSATLGTAGAAAGGVVSGVAAQTAAGVGAGAGTPQSELPAAKQFDKNFVAAVNAGMVDKNSADYKLYIKSQGGIDPGAAAGAPDTRSASEKAGLGADFSGKTQKGGTITYYKGGKVSGERGAGAKTISGAPGSVFMKEYLPQYEKIQESTAGTYKREPGWGGKLTDEVTGVAGATADVGKEFRKLKGLAEAPVEISAAGLKMKEALAAKQEDIDRDVASSAQTAQVRARRGGTRGGGSRERMLTRLGQQGLESKEDLSRKGLELEAADLATTQQFKRGLQTGMIGAAEKQRLAYTGLTAEQRKDAEMIRPEIDWQRKAGVMSTEAINRSELAEMNAAAMKKAGRRAKSGSILGGLLGGAGMIAGGMMGGPIGASAGGMIGGAIGQGLA